MLQKDTNRSLAGQVQANNTQLFGGLATINKVTATPAIANTATFVSEAPVKFSQPSANIHQAAIMSNRTSQPVMMMGAQPNASTFFVQSTPAQAVKVPTIHQAAP
jgi:hypothetical protein